VLAAYPSGEKKRASKSKAAEAGYGSEDDASGSDELEELNSDEAAWELDEMADRVRPPTYEESEAADSAESEEVKVKKEEEMVRALVRMAGPPPHPIRSIPCPVIIPQRRPRKKDRGFVRAYAPVLGDCGVGQEVFLQLLESWDKASRVCFAAVEDPTRCISNCYSRLLHGSMSSSWLRVS
jgi:hypothetical protein